MISLAKAGAPEAVKVDGAFFAIRTDFRNWILFSRMIRERHALTDFDFLYTDGIPEDRGAGLDALLDFYLDRQELPRVFGGGDGKEVVSYEHDAPLIYAAFLERYGIDLTDIDTRLHWHKFKALMSCLHDTKFNEVVGYRCYDESDKGDWKKNMKLNQKRWEIPEKLDAEQQEAQDEFDALLKG